jgi:peptidyl-tRNA hydrolase, PTH1 family
MTIKLIVGLRNPGDKYAKTRHNAGAWVLEAISSQWQTKKDFLADISEISWTDCKVLGVLPNTYMNLSGQSVAAVARFFRYRPEEILVIHDELDLPAGRIRLKKGGGHGGHNGLQDIIRHFGSNEFYRLRIGIGHPGDKNQVANYVLHTPSAGEKKLLDEAVDKIINFLPQIVKGQIEMVMNELHRD